jgi:hypothetical protein
MQQSKFTKNILAACIAAPLFLALNCGVTAPSSHQDISGLITSSGQGCGNFEVYRTDTLKSRWVIVYAQMDSLHISETAKEFDLKNTSPFLSVHFDYYSINKDETKQLSFIYCNDALDPNAQAPQRFKAIDGYAKISRSPLDTSGFFDTYNVTVQLQSVHFVDSLTGQTAFLKELTIDSVPVGWYQG